MSPAHGSDTESNRLDSARPIDLLAHPDLFQFLVHCLPGGSWSPDPRGEGIPSAQSGDLATFAIYAYELDRADPSRAEPRLWTIAGVPTMESSLMLAFVGTARSRAFQFGFTLGQRHHEREDPDQFAVAIAAHVGDDTMIAWLMCDGALLKRGDHIVGLRIAVVQEIEIEWRAGHRGCPGSC
ncbi:MAG: hypothetical protein KF729_38575 [Sandaracinaceae bacterium]|nr:hypothetical protein [Sandaracinaceae bacterium]